MRQSLSKGAVGLIVGALLAVLTTAGSLPAAAELSERPVVTAPFKADTVLVRFKPGTAQSAMTKLTRSQGMVKQAHLNPFNIQVFAVDPDSDAATVAAELRRNPYVEVAEPDYLVQAHAISNDAQVGSFWGLQNTGQAINGQAGFAGIDTNVDDAWASTVGEGVVVAVLDEGVDIAHPEFAGRIYRNNADCFTDGIDHDGNGYINDCNGWDFHHNDASVFDLADGDDHGTHVAGTIAAAVNNGVGGAGVAPRARILPLKFLGPGGGATSDAIRAIAYAKALGVRVINCSWGGGAYSELLRSAIANSGMTVIASAGNSGVNLATSPQYPASFDLPNQITVAAVDNRGALAGFSNRGGTTDLGAAGVDVLSTVPRDPAVSIGVSHTPTNGVYRSDFWGFGLEAVTGANKRRDLLRAAMTRLGASALNSPITVVDDDESGSGTPGRHDTVGYYTAALAAAGYTNVSVINVAMGASGPAEGTLNGRTVIWETGYAVSGSVTRTLTDIDLAQLTTFLDGGGKLLLAGADTIYRNESSTFVRDVLGVNFVYEGDDRTAATGTGASYNGISFDLQGADSPTGTMHPYNDVVSPWVAAAQSHVQLLGDADHSRAYGYKNGTSMAAPHVAGVAALVAAVAPTASGANIAGILRSTVRPVGSLAGVTRTGGIVDASAAIAAATRPPGSPAIPSSPAAANGYRFVAADGGIFAFGNASFKGSTGGSKLNEPIVGMSRTPDREGYWLVARDGGIFAFGNARFFGSTGGMRLNQPIVGIASTPTGNGYWLVARDGGIFAFGDARFFGSTGDIKLNQPIVGITSTPTGNGYWMVASDGGVFAYGDAGFFGSTGSIKLNQPIVGIAATPSGRGYWMAASDGGIFAFGDAGFHGSTGSLKLNRPIVGIAPTPGGYWLVASDGGIFAFGNAGFFGSTGAIRLNQPIVAMAN